MLRPSLFIAGMMVAASATAGSVSQCDANSIPIQIADATKIGSETTLSATRMPGSAPTFRAFAKAVTEQVAGRLSKENLCIDSTDSKKRSLLQFVDWRLFVRESEPTLVPSLDVQPSSGCRISSPWIDLAFERKPVPWVRAVVRWNQRQLIVDQAVLEGARNVPAGVAMPLNQSEFTQYSFDYSHLRTGNKRVAGHPIEGRVPADILWLYRRSWQSTTVPFGSLAMSAMDHAVETGAERYTKLVIALIDRCFASDGAEIQYKSILDVADLISLEQYKIVTPIR